MLSVRICALVVLLASAPACTPMLMHRPIEQRALADEVISRQGVEGDPAVEAAKAELEAELAREESETLVDGIQLRAGADVQGDTAVPLLARLPVANPLVVRAQRKAQHAASEAALSKLEGVALERRAALCVPSLDAQVHTQRTQIYERYASRQRAVLAWSTELGRAGMQDEIATAGFELSSQVDIATRAPEPPPTDVGSMPASRSFGVLPELPATASRFRAERDFVRDAVVQSQPAIGVHRALEDRYRALAQRENASRYPSLNFVDLGFEPVTHNGQQRSVLGRVAVEVPFGHRARAEAKHYTAMAIHETSRGRVEAEEHVEQALIALAQLQSFHDSGPRWRELIALADAAEVTADRWFGEQLAPPDDIAGLLDEIFRTRQAALDAREHAGLADCRLLAATGTPAASWPRE